MTAKKFTGRAKKGEVRNPKGINQYTYRREAELYFQQVLKDVDPKTGKPNLEVIIDTLIHLSKTKGGWRALEKILERVLPPVKIQEVSGSLEVGSAARDQLEERLARFARAQRANGADREPRRDGEAGSS